MVILTTELRNIGGYWWVIVNGQLIVDRESFEVADRVKFYLDHPEQWDYSESCEVADSIRLHFNAGLRGEAYRGVE